MSSKEVIIVRSVTQVTDGTHYTSLITIASNSFDCDVKLTVTIPELMKLGDEINAPSDLRKYFPIVIKRDGVEIELDAKEYEFFVSLLIEFVIGFYYDTQTRDANEGLIGKMIQGKGMYAGASASIMMTSSGMYSITDELSVMLSAPKFGCVFST